MRETWKTVTRMKGPVLSAIELFPLKAVGTAISRRTSVRSLSPWPPPDLPDILSRHQIHHLFTSMRTTWVFCSVTPASSPSKLFYRSCLSIKYVLSGTEYLSFLIWATLRCTRSSVIAPSLVGSVSAPPQTLTRLDWEYCWQLEDTASPRSQCRRKVI